jgi:fucose permease
MVLEFVSKTDLMHIRGFRFAFRSGALFVNKSAEKIQVQSRSQDRWPFVIGGFACLLGGAFYDNIRGPLLPPMAEALGIEFTEVGSFLAIGYASATLTTLLLIGALNRWAEGTVTTVLALIGTFVGFLSQMVTDRSSMYILAVFVGCAVSTLGTISNVLVVKGAPGGREGRLLSALHGMYGVGSALATMTVGHLISRGKPWSTPYFFAAPFFIGLSLYSVALLRSRKKAEVVRKETGKITPLQVFVVFLFSTYVAGEVMTATWMTTYLVRVQNMSVSEATPFLSVYFLIMTGMRLGCAFFLKPHMEKLILRWALLVPVGFFLLGYKGALWAFPLAGLYGPFFPVFLSRVTRFFNASARTLTILIMVGMNAMLGVCSLGLGRLADVLGMRQAYLLAPILLFSGFCLLNIYLWLEGKQAFRESKFDF